MKNHSYQSFLLLLCLLINSICLGQWTRQSSPTLLHLNSTCFLTDSLGYIVGDDGIVLKTETSGNIWNITDTLAVLTAKADLNDLLFVNDSIGIIVGDFGTIYRTTDYGNTWNYIDIEFYTGNFLSITRSSSTGRLYTVGTNGAVFTSNNQGLNWSKLNVPTTLHLMDALAFQDSSVAIVGMLGKVLTSHDNGKTWKDTNLNFNNNLFDITVLPNDSVLWLCGDSGMVMFSNDFGETWSDRSVQTNESLQGVQFYNETYGWIVGANGVMYKTSTGGEKWFEDTRLMSTDQLLSVYLRDGVGWAVGGFGTILRNEAEFVGLEINNLQGINIFPNPATQTLNIASQHDISLITILDSKGQTVLTTTPQTNEGIVSIDLDKISGGIYYVVVTNSVGILSKMIMKL